METLLGVRLFWFPTDLGSSPFLSNKLFAAMNLKKYAVHRRKTSALILLHSYPFLTPIKNFSPKSYPDSGLKFSYRRGCPGGFRRPETGSS